MKNLLNFFFDSFVKDSFFRTASLRRSCYASSFLLSSFDGFCTGKLHHQSSERLKQTGTSNSSKARGKEINNVEINGPFSDSFLMIIFLTKEKSPFDIS